MFLLILALAHTCIIYARRFARKKRIPIDLFFIALAVVFVIYGVNDAGETQHLKALTAWYAKWRFCGPIDPVYGWIFLYLLLALAAGIYGMVKKSAAGKFLCSVLIFFWLLSAAVWDGDWELLPAAALLFVCLDGFTEGYQYFIKKRRALSASYAFPFLAGTILLTCAFPAPKDPISWKWAAMVWERVERTVNEAVSRVAYRDAGREFGVGTIGFTEDGGGFWGKLTDGFSREMLEISDDGVSQGRERYFTGIIKEVYEENAWQWSKEQELKDAFYTGEDAYRFREEDFDGSRLSEMQWMLTERLHYLYRSGLRSREGERFCSSRVYTVRYKNLKTDVFFYPSNCFGLLPKDGACFVYAGDNVFFDEKQKSGDSYQVYGMQMNLGQEEFVDYLRTKETRRQPQESGTLFEECVRTLGLFESQIAWLKSDGLSAHLRARREEIRSRNLQIPEDITEDMRKLALRLTRDKENDYDRAMAVVAYLKEEGGFSYTHSPEEAPEGTDVMRHFLFEGKSGYCTYFATAATLLCRLAGVPARFVEGVTVDYGEAENGICPVEGRSAHAWAQVYIDGFGWLDVDASPGYGQETGDWREIGEQSHGYEGGAGDAVLKESPSERGTGERRDKEIRMREDASAFLRFFLIAMWLFLMLLLALKGGERLYYRSASLDKRTRILMYRILECLRRRCFAMERGETIRMYKNRLLSKDLIEAKTAEAFDWYEQMRYGGYEPTEEKVKRLEEICRKERERMKRECRLRRRKNKRGRME